MEKVYLLILGKYKLNFYVIYLDIEEVVDLNEIELKYFEKWVEWVKKEEIGFDFNLIFFLYLMMKDGFILVYLDKEVCEYWIEYGKRSCKIVEYFGKEIG